jgi:hypothetical protein
MVSVWKKILRESPLLISNLGPGIKATIESIDNRSDFKVYMQNYAYAHGGVQRGPRRTGPEHEGFVSCAHTVEPCYILI